MMNRNLVERDLEVLWHPCTQMKDHESMPLIPVKNGKGIWLEDFDGNRYMDAISSWWVNIFGHANPDINNAIKRQLDSIEHVILAGFTHEPIVELSEKLVEITPAGLNRCFYADNGSSSIEVALKMSFHYWQNLGKTKKTKFINIENSYHGETLAALAVGDVALYKESYGALLMEPLTAPSPDCYYCPEGMSREEYSIKQFTAMEQLIKENADEACAVIIEPLIQCAGSMRMFHPVYMKLLREACDRYGVHLIADEIAVGFGRTGTMFACEQSHITPDFMLLSKGITGGYLPLAVCMTTDEIYNAFYDDYETLKAFLHSHSYTGNALACAAALETISIFERDDVIANNRELSQYMYDAVAHLHDHPHIADIRQTGMVLAIEMAQNKNKKTPYDWKERRGLRVYQHALKNEALLRPLGNVIYLMPPYIITKEQIDHLAKVITAGVEIATK